MRLVFLQLASVSNYARARTPKQFCEGRTLSVSARDAHTLKPIALPKNDGHKKYPNKDKSKNNKNNAAKF